jgi:hypothetical protein
VATAAVPTTTVAATTVAASSATATQSHGIGYEKRRCRSQRR